MNLQSSSQGPSASAYVTYQRPEDTLRAIQAVNNIHVDGRTLKASLGTTKYCSHFLKGSQCPKPVSMRSQYCQYAPKTEDAICSFELVACALKGSLGRRKTSCVILGWRLLQLTGELSSLHGFFRANTSGAMRSECLSASQTQVPRYGQGRGRDLNKYKRQPRGGV